MLYQLALWLDSTGIGSTQFIEPLTRLTGYLSVRAIAALLSSFVVTMLLGGRLIRWLHRHHIRDRVKDFGSISATDKRGTPTMGGVIVIAATLIPTLLWADLTNRFVQIVVGAIVWFGIVGALDDYLKLHPRKGRRGLAPLQKLVLQGMFGVALGIVYLLPMTSPVSQEIASDWFVPFYKHAVLDNLGWFYLPYIVFVVMLISNSVNLTDGMDGLAIMPANFAVVVYGIIAYVLGNVVFARYLQFEYLAGTGELLVVCASLFGAGTGFLWYNAYPAQVIMGDTGSMALGGVLASLAIILKQEVLFIIVGGVFIVEAFSSLIQEKVGENYLGRRIFYRAPFHHQMEYQGLAETKVVIRMWIVAGILAMLGLASLKIR
jgi:phospho-N-acetylmuramoyl-pentapeptide-transferase